MREMKDSGIEWIGKVPYNWQIMPNKYLMKKIKDIIPIYNGENILSLTMNGVIIRDLDAGGKMPTTFDGYQKLYPNNLLMCLFDMDVTPRCIGLIKNSGISSPAYSQFKLNVNAYSNYYYYYYLMLDSTKELLHLAKNLRHSLTEGQLGEILTVVPPYDEQTKISKYIDDKSSKIDSLTCDIKLQIEKLEEYKKSIITEAVTKGLDPNVKMKDSGIEWIGKIPNTWNCSKLNYECYIRARLGWKGLKADEYVDEGYALLSAFNIQDNKMMWNNINYINKQRYDESPEIKLSIGDILLVKDGAGIGKTARIDELPMGECTTNSSLAVITPFKNLNYKYLSFYFQSSIFSNFINRVLYGMGVPHLTQEIMKSIYILLPTYDEQLKIVDYLDIKCNEISHVIDLKKEQLSKLEEYKKSMIYEYVTGKKEAI